MRHPVKVKVQRRSVKYVLVPVEPQTYYSLCLRKPTALKALPAQPES